MAKTTAEDRIDPQAIKTAVVLIVGSLAVVFDTTIISVALRTLSVELHAQVSTIQWVSTGYLLALGAAIPLAGWAQARFGGKRVWMFALAVFMISSVLCSLSWSAASLIAFRVAEGLGGGLMLPLFSTIIMQAAAGRALGRTMSAVTLPMVAGPIAGPVIGGAILNWLDWRWLFWVNVPFCVAGFILAWRMLDPDATSARPRIDITGWLLLSPGLVAVLLGLSNSSQDGGFGRADAFGPLLAGTVLLVTFTVHSVRRAGHALVDLRLLAHRPLASATALTFLSGAALYGSMVLLPLYWQDVRGTDALRAGLLLAPQGIGALLSRPLAGGLTDRVGARRVAFTGSAIVAFATVPFALASATTSQWVLMAVLVVRGLGLATVMIPLSAAAFVGLRREQIPHAGIITRIAQQVGGSFGVAVLAVILAAALRNPGTHPGPAATTTAFNQAFWWAIGFTAVALLLSLMLPGPTSHPDTHSHTANPPAYRLIRRHGGAEGGPGDPSGNHRTSGDAWRAAGVVVKPGHDLGLGPSDLPVDEIGLLPTIGFGEGRLPTGCSGEQPVGNDVDGETEPLVAVAGDHLRGVGDDKREAVGRQVGEGLVDLADLLATIVVGAALRAPHIVLAGGGGHQQHEDVASPGGVLGLKPASEQDSQQVLSQEQNRFGRGRIGQGHRGDPGVSDQSLMRALKHRVQLSTPA